MLQSYFNGFDEGFWSYESGAEEMHDEVLYDIVISQNLRMVILNLPCSVYGTGNTLILVNSRSDVNLGERSVSFQISRNNVRI